jgi:hypothetical protein
MGMPSYTDRCMPIAQVYRQCRRRYTDSARARRKNENAVQSRNMFIALSLSYLGGGGNRINFMCHELLFV